MANGDNFYEDEGYTFFDETTDFEADMGEMYGIQDDPYAMELLHVGWFDREPDSDSHSFTEDERHEARTEFFDYMNEMEGWDYEDFDWDAWREYMGYED